MLNRNRPPLIAGGGIYGQVTTSGNSIGGNMASGLNKDRHSDEDVWVSTGNGKAVKVPAPRTLQDVERAVEMVEKAFATGGGKVQSVGVTRNTSSVPDPGMLLTQLSQLAKLRGYGQEWIAEVDPDGSSHKGADFGKAHSQVNIKPGESDMNGQSNDLNAAQKGARIQPWDRRVWTEAGVEMNPWLENEIAKNRIQSQIDAAKPDRPQRSANDSGFGGSRGTSERQAEGGGGGTFNKYVAALKALRAGYPDYWAMMTGDRTPRVAGVRGMRARSRMNKLTQSQAHFAYEIEQRYKDYRNNGGHMNMTDFINNYDYGSNREAYLEQRALEQKIAENSR